MEFKSKVFRKVLIFLCEKKLHQKVKMYVSCESGGEYK